MTSPDLQRHRTLRACPNTQLDILCWTSSAFIAGQAVHKRTQEASDFTKIEGKQHILGFFVCIIAFEVVIFSALLANFEIYEKFDDPMKTTKTAQ